MEILCAFVLRDKTTSKVKRVMWRNLIVRDNRLIVLKHRGKTLAYASYPSYTFLYQGKRTTAFYDEEALPIPPSEFFKISNLSIKKETS